MENYIIQKEVGKIVITEKVIKKVVLKAIGDVGNKIIFTDSSWKPARWGRGIDIAETNHVEITCVDDGICVELYLLIRGGYSPNDITNEIIARIDKSLIVLTGRESSSITLNIQKNTKLPLVK